MSDNAEEGIAKAQAQVGGNEQQQQKRLAEHQALAASNMSDRLLSYLVTLAFFGLVAVWMTATSDLLIYGSFFGAMVAFVLFGWLKIKRLERLKALRKQQADEWNSKDES